MLKNKLINGILFFILIIGLPLILVLYPILDYKSDPQSISSLQLLFSEGKITLTSPKEYFSDKGLDIAASFLASILFAIFIFGSTSIPFFNEIIRKWLLSKIQAAPYNEDTVKDALSKLEFSVTSTNLFFIRIGGSFISKQDFKKPIKNIIEHPNIWDYHIFLMDLSNNLIFLNDFFELQTNDDDYIYKVDSVKDGLTVR